MRKLHLESWEAFRSFVYDDDVMMQPWTVRAIWRGQRNPLWPLASSFERQLLARKAEESSQSTELPRNVYVSDRDSYLAAFVRTSSGLRGSSPTSLSVEQWWALGRHYGLTTPLLDWTTSPFVAAYFALRDLLREMRRPGGAIGLTGTPVAIYRLLIAVDSRVERRLSALRIIEPTLDELLRLQGQRGLFTWLDSHEHFDVETYLDACSSGDALTQVVLAEDAVYEGMTDLRLHGIDERTMFPDLGGAARAANDDVDLRVLQVARPLNRHALLALLGNPRSVDAAE